MSYSSQTEWVYRDGKVRALRVVIRDHTDTVISETEITVTKEDPKDNPAFKYDWNAIY